MEQAHLRQVGGPVPGQVQEGSPDVHPDHAPGRTDASGQLAGGLSRTAADVDDHVSRCRIQGVDGSQPQRRQLEIQKLAYLDPGLSS